MAVLLRPIAVLVGEVSSALPGEMLCFDGDLEVVRATPDDLGVLLDTLVCDVLITGMLGEPGRERVLASLEAVPAADRPLVVASPSELAPLMAGRYPALARELSVGQYTLNTERIRLYRRNKPVHLGPADFRLATLLIRHAGRPLTRKQIRNTISGRQTPVDERAVDRQVKRLRDALGRTIESPVESVRGIGYRWAA